MKPWKAAPIAVFGALIVLGGCGEIDQKAKVDKVYSGKKDTRASDDSRFKGDKKKWEETLEARSRTQNEYIRTGGAAK
jgi:hypothetical protein